MEATKELIPEKVGIRELRENLANYLLESDKPITITRHGEMIGMYFPVKKKRTDPDWDAFFDAHAAVQEEMAKAGVTEDDIIADMEEIRKTKRG